MSDYVIHSPFADVDIPRVTVTQHVLRKCSERADHPAIVDGLSGNSLTFSELATRIRRLAGGLQVRGFKPGDVLALMAPNCPDFAVVFHATALCGGTLTTLNPGYGIAEVRQQLLDSKASWIIACQNSEVVCKQAMRGTSANTLVSLEDTSRSTCVSNLLAHEVDQVDVNLDMHPVVLPYSSGTTGFPKGVMLSHANLVANLVQMNAAFEYEQNEVGLAILPFFHIFGMQVLMGSLLSEGHTIVTLPRFDMGTSLSLIEQHAVTQFFVVPPVVLGLAKSPLVDNHDVSSLRKVFCGAAPLGAELAEEAATRLNCAVVQGYGMTELSPVSHSIPGFANKPGSSGVLIPNTQARIVDPDGNNLPPNTEGELLVKGPQVMIGYLNNSQATTETLDTDGWLHTGDLAIIDEDGYMSIVDRVKELIKYKGFQIAPAELEALIITHPDVADVAVIGIPDKEAGELPKAFVVIRADVNSSGADQIAQKSVDVMQFVNNQVAGYKAVKEVQWVDAIPKSPSGKILRRLLRDNPPSPVPTIKTNQA